MTTTEKEYVLGTDDAEVRRLGWQHRVWADAAVAQWRRAGFKPGDTILDLGCGPGFASRELAQLVGAEGRVLAIDQSARYIDFVTRHQSVGGGPIDARVGDAHDLDLPDNSVDGAYARWVLSFTPEPPAVVEQVARVLRPGAAFAVQDYSNWMGLHWGPRNETLPLLREAILGAYSEARADSFVGQKVPAMMEANAIEVLDIRPLSRTARPGDAMWEWPSGFFKLFLPRLVERGHMTQRDYERWEQEWDSLTREEGAFFHTPPQVEVIGRKR